MNVKNLRLSFVISILFVSNAIAQIPTNGLIAWWPFTGNANDLSGNGLNGVVSSAVLTKDRFGNPNCAYDFNGRTAFIKVFNNSKLDLTNDFTISSWFKADSLYVIPGTTSMILSKHWNGIDDQGYVYGIWGGVTGTGVSTGIVNFQAPPFFSTATYPQSAASFVSVNKWYNLTVTYSKTTGTLTYYLNGNKIDTIPIGLNITNTSFDVIIGAETLISGNGYKNWFNGILDDIGIWNRVLTPQEIQNVFNNGICYQTVTVTDTLIIKLIITGYNPITYQNTIKVYPNPTNDQLIIDNGDWAALKGYQLKITNSLGQQVFQSAINQQLFTIDLSKWPGRGAYFVYVIDVQGNMIDVRKVILQ